MERMLELLLEVLREIESELARANRLKRVELDMMVEAGYHREPNPLTKHTTVTEAFLGTQL